MLTKNSFVRLLVSGGLLFTLAACQSTPTLTAPNLAGKNLMWQDGANEHCEIPPSIHFAADGRVSGDAGCNRLLGSYTQNGAQLDLSHLGSTKRMCGPKLMEVENAFLNHLSKTRYAIEQGDNVILLDENKKPLITLVPERLGACD